MPNRQAAEVARDLSPEFVVLDIDILVRDAFGQEEDRRRYSKTGFDHHVVKLVDFDFSIWLIGRGD